MYLDFSVCDSVLVALSMLISDGRCEGNVWSYLVDLQQAFKKCVTSMVPSLVIKFFLPHLDTDLLAGYDKAIQGAIIALLDSDEDFRTKFQDILDGRDN